MGVKYSRNIKKCISCGAAFLLTDVELFAFAQAGMCAPKRCINCRRERAKQLRLEREEIKRKAEEEERRRRKAAERIAFETALQSWNTISMDEAVPNDDNVLYILGNGFDLMHGVQSSYYSFRDSLGKKSGLRFRLESYLKSDHIWADFENALGKLNLDMIIGAPVLDTYLDVNGVYDEIRESDYLLPVEQAVEPFQQLTEELQTSFRAWVETLTIGTPDRPLKKLFRNGRVLCFNYTEFVETMYGIPSDRVCYIHGCRRRAKGAPPEHLVLGHSPDAVFPDLDPYDQAYLNSLGKGKAMLVELARDNVMDYVVHYDMSLTKHSMRIISFHRPFFDGLREVDKVIVIGHSHSKVDWEYFAAVHAHINSAVEPRWYFGCHGIRDLENLEKMLDQIGIDKKYVNVFRTDEISVSMQLQKKQRVHQGKLQSKSNRDYCASLLMGTGAGVGMRMHSSFHMRNVQRKQFHLYCLMQFLKRFLHLMDNTCS